MENRNMNKEKDNLLEDSEGIAIIAGFMIGTAILSLPNAAASNAKQDSWMSAIVGGIYPVFLSFVLVYFVKKHPNEDILVLSKKYLGNVIGTICNILFMVHFAIYFTAVATALSFVFIVHVTLFLSPLKIYVPSILLAIYLSHKGIKVMGRINIIALYLILFLVLSSIATVQRGTILNVLPVFGAGYKNIIKGGIQAIYAYTGMEGIFLIYPCLKNKKNIKAIALKATSIAIVVYTWITFVCIYYLGYKVASKNLWPVLLTTESINLPVLNSNRVPFLFLWTMIILKLLANNYYSIVYSLKNVFKNKNKTILYWISFPILLSLCLMVKNEIQRRSLINIVAPISTIFNIMYISIIGICIFLNDKIGRDKN